MDEAYASPSSDGHATLPSPTDSTFDLSLLPPPRRRRNRPHHHHPPTSSFIQHAPTSPDSSASDDEDPEEESFLKWEGYQRMLPSSSPHVPVQDGSLVRDNGGNGNGKGIGRRGRRMSPPARLTLDKERGREQSPESETKESAPNTNNSAAMALAEVSRAGAVVDESITRAPTTTTTNPTNPTTITNTSTAMVTRRHSNGQGNDTETPPGSEKRRNLLSQGPGIEPMYPVSGGAYGRRKRDGIYGGGDIEESDTSAGDEDVGSDGANVGGRGRPMESQGISAKSQDRPAKQRATTQDRPVENDVNVNVNVGNNIPRENQEPKATPTTTTQAEKVPRQSNEPTTLQKGANGQDRPAESRNINNAHQGRPLESQPTNTTQAGSAPSQDDELITTGGAGAQKGRNCRDELSEPQDDTAQGNNPTTTSASAGQKSDNGNGRPSKPQSIIGNEGRLPEQRAITAQEGGIIPKESKELGAGQMGTHGQGRASESRDITAHEDRPLGPRAMNAGNIHRESQGPAASGSAGQKATNGQNRPESRNTIAHGNEATGQPTVSRDAGGQKATNGLSRPGSRATNAHKNESAKSTVIESQQAANGQNRPEQRATAAQAGNGPNEPIVTGGAGRQKASNGQDESSKPQTTHAQRNEPTGSAVTGGASGQSKAPEKLTAPSGNASCEGQRSNAHGDPEKRLIPAAIKTTEPVSTTPAGDPPRRPRTVSPPPEESELLPTLPQPLYAPITPANKKFGAVPPLRRRSASPIKPTPSPPRRNPSPESFLGKTPRYLNWLNSSMDDAEVPVGHRERLREVMEQGQGQVDESGFVGGDELGSEDDDEEYDGEYDRARGEKSFFDDGEEDEEESRLMDMSPVIPAEGVDPYDGANDDRAQERGIKRRKKTDDHNTVYHTLDDDSASASDDNQIPPQTSSPQRQPSPVKKMSEIPPPIQVDPTMPQFFSNAPSSSTSTAPARPSIAQVQKVQKPRSTTLIGKKSFNELLLAAEETAPRTVYNLTELKASGRGRRVSMNSPPSSREHEESGEDVPPDFSSLGSGFSFASVPVRYKGRVGDVEEASPAKVMGSEEAPSEGTVTVEKSRSDPEGIRRWMESRGLVVPMRVGETKEDQDRRSGRRESVEFSENDSGDNTPGNRGWSGLTQRFHRPSAAASDHDHDHDHDHITPANTKNPANITTEAHRGSTPASIGESKDLISDPENGSSKTLWFRMAQAETENNRFRKLLSENNIKIDESDESFTDDAATLRRRIAELEGLLQIVTKKHAEAQADNERKENLVMHWKNQYGEVQKLALQNRQRALKLEGKVKSLEQQAAADESEMGRVVSKLSEKQDMVKGARQKSLGLEERLAAAQNQVKDAKAVIDEKEKTIVQLRESLERRRAFNISSNSGAACAEELQEKIYSIQKEHADKTTALTSQLEEREGLVRHLQAELDEMVNLMPVDHGSSRMIDEDEVEDWLDEKSREISQYYDDGLDQIITELHGGGEREDFEEAVEEAEGSLRKAAEMAGLDEPLDKATLAAFGIRQLRTEHGAVKRRLVENEKRLAEMGEKLLRRSDLPVKLRVSEEQRTALQDAIQEAEAKAKTLTTQLDSLREKLAGAEQVIRNLEAETEVLESKLSDAEEKSAALEEEKEALRVLVNDTKRLTDMLKSQVSESEQRRTTADEETTSLRRQLTEEKAHVNAIETEAISLRQQLTHWEATVAEKESALKEVTEKVRADEKEKVALRRQLDDAARNQVASKEAESLKRAVKELQERARVLNETHAGCSVVILELEGKARTYESAVQRLTAGKADLKEQLEVAMAETKAARGRFAQLLHDTAQKETVRSGTSSGSVSGTGEDPESCRRALHIIVTEIERCSLPLGIELGKEEKVDIPEGVQDPELVRLIIRAVRTRSRLLGEVQERCAKYKGAARRHLKDAERRKARVEELMAEVRELGVKLKTERRGNDEKMGQMILALRKGE